MPGHFDKRVGALTRIAEEHEQVHKGKSFTVSVVNTIMGDADTLILAFRTGNQTIHFCCSFTVALGGDIEICEEPVWTAGSGTPVQIVNKNRAYQIPSSILTEENGIPGYVLQDPEGYECNHQKFGSTRLGFFWFFKPTDNTRMNHVFEYILKKNTNYGIKYTAAVAQGWWATDAAQLTLDWYEVVGNWYSSKVRDFQMSPK